MALRLSHVPGPEARAATLSLVVAVLLLALKFVAYWLTGSTAVFSDAMESIVNVVAAAFGLYSLMLAHAPADREHPYGHGKVEFLSATFEGGMILLAALVIFWRAVETLARGPALEQLNLGLLLLGIATLVNAVVGLYLIRTGASRNSMTLEAGGKHLLSDAVTSIVALAALGVVRLTGWSYADPLGAVLVALYIGWMAWGLLRRSAGGLMDEQDRADELLLRRILDEHLGPDGRDPRICSYHKLRHRHSGRYHWVDFHIMVPASWDIARGHTVASAIEYEIEQALGEGNATAHVEPCVDETCPMCEKSEVERT